MKGQLKILDWTVKLKKINLPKELKEKLLIKKMRIKFEIIIK
jgi:hypothetical protein